MGIGCRYHRRKKIRQVMPAVVIEDNYCNKWTVMHKATKITETFSIFSA
jgi:hypothetical protein